MHDGCRFRDAEYRRPLVLQELLGFHADILCLQEVDEKAFKQYFQPHFDFAGEFRCVCSVCVWAESLRWVFRL